RARERRAAPVHADGRGTRRPGHRQLPRRCDHENRFLERLQGAGRLVGGAPSILSRRRTVALAAWLGVGAAWYFSVDSVPLLPLWWAVALLSFVLIPGVFAFDWIVLPLARARGLLPLAATLAVCAILAEAGDLEVLANAAKLGAITFFAFWFLRL